MSFVALVKGDLPPASILGFFSPHFILRALLYEQLKNLARRQHVEYCFYDAAEQNLMDRIHAGVVQQGLFASAQCHVVYFDEKDIAAASTKVFLKDVTALVADKTLAWPLFFVGGFKLTPAHKKHLSSRVVIVPEPRLDQSAELIHIYPYLQKHAGIPHIPFDYFNLCLQSAAGDMTQAVYMCLKHDFERSSASSREARRDAEKSQTQDIFTFCKRILYGSEDIARVLEASQKMFHGTSDWLPFLGLVQRLAFSLKNSHRRARVMEAVAAIDSTIKHFYPSAKQSITYPFLMFQISKHGR